MAAKRKPVVKARRPAQERSRETVKAIVQAGERVLLQEGKEAFTTNRVAVVAGVSKGTLYEYFRSTEDLLRAVEERSWSNVLSEIAQAIADAPARSAEEGLASVIEKAMDVLGRRIAMHGLTFDTMTDEATGRKRMLGTFARAGVVRLRERAPAERLRPADLELAAEIIVCLLPFLSWLESRAYTDRAKEFRAHVVTLVTSFLLYDR